MLLVKRKDFEIFLVSLQTKLHCFCVDEKDSNYQYHAILLHGSTCSG